MAGHFECRSHCSVCEMGCKEGVAGRDARQNMRNSGQSVAAMRTHSGFASTGVTSAAGGGGLGESRAFFRFGFFDRADFGGLPAKL